MINLFSLTSYTNRSLWVQWAEQFLSIVIVCCNQRSLQSDYKDLCCQERMWLNKLLKRSTVLCLDLSRCLLSCFIIAGRLKKQWVGEFCLPQDPGFYFMAATEKRSALKERAPSQLWESSRFLQKLSTFLGVWATGLEGLDPTLETEFQCDCVRSSDSAHPFTEVFPDG